MRRLLNWLSRKRYPYEPLIHVGISRSRLIHNLQEFRKLAPNGTVAPVLKSNAYGHGLYEVAKILQHEPNIPFFVVDSYFEAVALRARGIKTPLLVIGYTRPRTIVESNLRNVGFTVTTMETLRALKETLHPVRIQIKVDTGFHRQGIDPSEVAEALDIIQENDNIFLDGVCTHLCDADNDDESFTDSQLIVWNKIVAQCKTYCPNLRYIHGCNSDGSRFSADTHDNLIRLGIGLYGLSETEAITRQLRLTPVLSMDTIVTSIRTVGAGETVGYSRTFSAPEDMKVATVPVGYFEGIDRRLSSGPGNESRLSFKVGPDSINCPVIGRVSMNITSIDVSNVPEVSVGMPVQVISDNTTDQNSIHAMAKACGTITYELAVRIPSHLKREIRD